eukprot:gnl/TRDRNA2_/TRDRNA2_37903_c0_seq1.p2 gnl/TRDRNA2_/TRDRNA2_37903_c0~~gnl/TRDRNA2_/TRDRNA2_37903_c0_seq1.p2  ORF type:complete len:161 (+),score=48.59 gnl/TRDRNA2_/TRDRNA2_37903_c0_seq1:101-583(+)
MQLHLLVFLVAAASLEAARVAVRGQPRPMTDQERIEYAQKTIADVLARQKAAANGDVSKSSYCEKHGKELEDKVKEAKDYVDKVTNHKVTLQGGIDRCGCCCDDYHTLQTGLIRARKDLEYQDVRVKNLQKQVEHLAAWCVDAKPTESKPDAGALTVEKE